MADSPAVSNLDLTSNNVFANTAAVLEQKYNDAWAWATYAAGILQEQNTSLSTANNQFDISTFLDAASSAITNIPTPPNPDDIIFAAPVSPAYATLPPITPGTPPQFNSVEMAVIAAPDIINGDYIAPLSPSLDVTAYQAPDKPILADAAYIAPLSPSLDVTAYQAPTAKTLTNIPSPIERSAGDAPSTTIVFDNSDFTNGLASALQGKITDALATGGTGLGDAEAALFARETARQNTTRSKAYDEITSQFSSRGFDVPPGAMLAKQTEVNNESAIRLSDSSSQIMAESARLAVDYNKSVMSVATQTTDILARIHDSKIMRGFEAAKTSVMMALEGFKTSIQVLIANSELEGKYLGVLAQNNKALIDEYSAEVQAEVARLNAVVDANKSKVAIYQAEIGAATAELNAIVEVNRSKSGQYSAEVQAEVARLNAVVDANKSKVAIYQAEIGAATAELNATVERNKASLGIYTGMIGAESTRISAVTEMNKASLAVYTSGIQAQIATSNAVTEGNKALASQFTAEAGAQASYAQAQGQRNSAAMAGYEVGIKKAMGVADIAKSMALSGIDAATRKYLGEIQNMQSASQSAAQMIASALNSVNVSASLGASGGWSSSTTEDLNATALGNVHTSANI